MGGTKPQLITVRGHIVSIIYIHMYMYMYMFIYIYIPVVPHKAVAEVSKIGNL